MPSLLLNINALLSRYAIFTATTHAKSDQQRTIRQLMSRVVAAVIKAHNGARRARHAVRYVVEPPRCPRCHAAMMPLSINHVTMADVADATLMLSNPFICQTFNARLMPRD